MELDEDTGFAQYCPAEDKDAPGNWCMDYKFRTQLYETEDGVAHLIHDGVNLGAHSDLKRQTKLIDVEVSPKGSGMDALTFKAALFTYPAFGGYVWYSVQHMWEALGLNMSPHSGAAWFQLRRKTWAKAATLLQLGDESVRNSVPYNNEGVALPPEDDVRILKWSAVSTAMMLNISFSSAYTTDKNDGMLGTQSSKDAFARVATGMLEMVSRKERYLTIKLDPDVRRVGDTGYGMCPATLRIMWGGNVDLEALRADVEKYKSRISTYGLTQLEEMFKGEDVPFLEFMIRIKKLSCRKKNKLCLAVYAQLLWKIASIVEERHSAGNPCRTQTGTQRGLKREESSGGDRTSGNCTPPYVGIGADPVSVPRYMLSRGS